MKKIAKILIVEDNAVWAAALYRMYKTILKQTRPEVEYDIQTVVCVEQAIDRIERDNFTIVSLDLNLSSTEEGGDGRRVLEVLAEYQPARCNAVIVATGIKCDEDLNFYLKEGEHVIDVILNINSLLDEFFPGHNGYLFKPDFREFTNDNPLERLLRVNRCTQSYSQINIGDRHRDIVDFIQDHLTASQPVTLSPPYVIVSQGKQIKVLTKPFRDGDDQEKKEELVKTSSMNDRTLTIKQVKKRNYFSIVKKMIEHRQSPIGKKDSFFSCLNFYEFMMAYDSTWKPEEEEDQSKLKTLKEKLKYYESYGNLEKIKETYQCLANICQKVAHERMQNFKKWLRDPKRGLDPDKLFISEKNLGWRLLLDPDDEIF